MAQPSPCIRCGKLRIKAKTWTEKVNGSPITYTQTVCPDPECQKIVDRELKMRMDKIKGIQQKSLERRKLNRRNKKDKKRVLTRRQLLHKPA